MNLENIEKTAFEKNQFNVSEKLESLHKSFDSKITPKDGTYSSDLSKYQRNWNDWLNMDYDEEDDSVTAEMRASISEARQKRALEDENRDKVSGPAFDENLKNATEALGPDGSSRFIAGKEGG